MDMFDVAESARSALGCAEYFEYSKAANPIRPSLTPPVPFRFFPASLHDGGSTRVVPLDLSDALRCASPATGPGLCAHFVRIEAGDEVVLEPNATSLVFFVIRGAGAAEADGARFDWAEGDFFTAPGGAATRLHATGDAALYYVNDAPLLTYLGVAPTHARFRPTLYPAARANAELAAIANDQDAANRSRVSVLLGNSEFPMTRTVTHVLWAMYGLINTGTVQKPHRHQSIALDFIVSCRPGCYSLIGEQLNADGTIRNPTRVDWESGSAFITPPGLWHAHVNESGAEARLIPIQDAGLQTYLRTLDIRFT